MAESFTVKDIRGALSTQSASEFVDAHKKAGGVNAANLAALVDELYKELRDAQGQQPTAAPAATSAVASTAASQASGRDDLRVRPEKVELEKFDGVKVDFLVWRLRAEQQIARHKSWSEKEKLFFIETHVAGPALDFVYSAQAETAAEVLNSMESRFVPRGERLRRIGDLATIKQAGKLAIWGEYEAEVRLRCALAEEKDEDQIFRRLHAGIAPEVRAEAIRLVECNTAADLRRAAENAAQIAKALGQGTVAAVVHRQGKSSPQWRGKPGERQKGVHRSDKCKRCGGAGHFAKDCPSPDNRTCNKCGQVGHLAASCPRKLSAVAAATPAPTTPVMDTDEAHPEETEDTMGSEYVCCVEVGYNATYARVRVGGISLKAIIDSGSAYTIVREDVWRRMTAEAPRPCTVTPETAGSAPMRIAGVGRVSIGIGSVGRTQTVLIAPDLVAPVILGVPTLTSMGVTIDYRSGRLWTSTTESVPMTTVLGDKAVSCTLHATAATTLQPGECAWVEAAGALRGDVVLISDRVPATEMSQVWVHTGVTRLDNQRTQVLVENTGRRAVQLQQGACLAIAEKVEAVNGERPKYEIDPRLGNDERKQVEGILKEFSDVLVDDLETAGAARVEPHEIRTGDSRPIRVGLRRYSPAELAEGKKIIDKLMKSGAVRKSRSRWCSPVVLARKKDGSMRLCIDYRRLNEVTELDAYPLPRIDQTLERLAGAKYFSLLDLASGYWQIPLREEDAQKTAFAFDGELYEMPVVPMGICNAPPTFQRVTNSVLGDMLGKDAMVYIDDVIIYSRTWQEHLTAIRKVLERLRRVNMKAKAGKCHFGMGELTYLGHKVSSAGIAPDDDKVRALKAAEPPKNARDVKSFLGTASYYRCFIAGFARRAAPLNRLLSNGVAFEWAAAEQAAFEDLRDALTTAPVLAYPDFTRPFEVHTDASTEGLGAVLVQHDGDGRPRAVRYLSRTLKDAERHYSVPELECLAVVWATAKLRSYIEGLRFTIVTDHYGLQWLKAKKEDDTPSRVHRWAISMSRFDYSVVYKKGRLNVADFISRHPVRSKGAGAKIAALTRGAAKATGEVVRPIKEATRELERTEREREEREREVEAAKRAMVKTKKAAARAQRKKTGEGKKEARDQPAGADEQKGEGVPPPQPTSVAEAQQNDEDVQAAIRFLAGKPLPDDPIRKQAVRELVTGAKVKNGLLVKLWSDVKRAMQFERVVVPQALRKLVLEQVHDAPLAGHQGLQRTYDMAREKFTWPGMYKDVKKHVEACIECQQRKGQPGMAVGQMVRREVIGDPFASIAIDFLKLPKSTKGREHVLVVTDRATRQAEAFACFDEKAETVARKLIKVVAAHGAPVELLSDRGRDFMGKVVQILTSVLGVRKKNTAGYNPKCNGMTERFNRTLPEMLAKYVAENGSDWDCWLPLAVSAYNAAPHAETGESPFFLNHGRLMRQPVDVAILPEPKGKTIATFKQELRKRLEAAGRLAQEVATESAKKQESDYNKHHQRVTYEPGDMVFRKNSRLTVGRGRKLARPWAGPYRVREKTSPVNYVLEDPRTGHRLRAVVNVDKIKRAKSSV